MVVDDATIRALREDIIAGREEIRRLRADLDVLRSGRAGTLGWKGGSGLVRENGIVTRLIKDGAVTDEKIESLRVEKLSAGELQVDVEITTGRLQWGEGTGRLSQEGIQLESPNALEVRAVSWVEEIPEDEDVEGLLGAQIYGKTSTSLDVVEVYMEAVEQLGFAAVTPYSQFRAVKAGDSASWSAFAANAGGADAGFAAASTVGDSEGIITTYGVLTLYNVTSDPAPSLLGDGALVYRTDTDKIRARVNGAWVDLGGGGMLKTASGGYFLIPTGPSAGTTVADSGTANTYGSWVEMSSSAPADLFIIGVRIGLTSVTTAVSYTQIDIGTGAAAAETSVGEFIAGGSDVGVDAGVVGHTLIFPFPIPIASGTRIAARTADNVAAAHNYAVTLICINQADLATI